MKKLFYSALIMISLILISSAHGSAQITDIGKILSGGVDDANKIVESYIRPVASSVGANFNSGWYNTAKVHDLLGFHITFTTSVALVPEEDFTYDLDELNLDGSYPSDENIARTVSGEKVGGPELEYTPIASLPASSFGYNLPAGTGLTWFPTPMVSAGFGLPKGIEINGRYMPTIKYGDTKDNSVGLWGVGLKFGLKEHLPFIKRVPILHLTLQYGYTDLAWHTDFTTVTPENIGAVDMTSGTDWDAQDMDMKIKGHTANLIIGANLPVVSLYGSVGLSNAKTNLVTNGYFPVPTSDINDPGFDPLVLSPQVTDNSRVLDPLDVEIKSKTGGVTSPRLGAGVRFKFAVVTIHFDYYYANYSVATAGLGISFR